AATFAGQLVYWIKLLTDLCLVRLTGVPIVCTLHNLLPHECRFPRLEYFFRRQLVRLVACVLAHGRQSREDAICVLGVPAAKVVVVRHGHFRDLYPPATPELRRASRGGLADEHRVFLFFGMMRPYKGLERLLRVWRDLTPHNASLWLVGPCPDPNYETQLRSMAHDVRGVRLDCRFVAHENIPAVFAGADLVVLPFERVQTSGSAILALTFGRPVIAPRLGEVPETLGSAGDLLFDGGSDDALRKAISAALDVELPDLAARSSMACDRLDWGPIGRQTAAAYAAATTTGKSKTCRPQA